MRPPITARKSISPSTSRGEEAPSVDCTTELISESDDVVDVRGTAENFANLLMIDGVSVFPPLPLSRETANRQMIVQSSQYNSF